MSGYAPLALLPVVWIALNLGRQEVAVGIAVGASVFVLPLLVGDPASYTSGDWRRAVLWAGVAADRRLLRRVAHARSKRAQTREAREHERTIAAIADVSRALTGEIDARSHICRATLEIAEARFAAIWEPDGPGELVITGRAGPDPGRSRLPLNGEASGVGTCVRERGHAISSPTPWATPRYHRTRCSVPAPSRCSSSRSYAAGVPIGVLSVGWAHHISEVDVHMTEAVALLAIEAAVAIERADFLARLSDLAETDELTGLPNRRAWDEAIRRRSATRRERGARSASR